MTTERMGKITLRPLHEAAAATIRRAYMRGGIMEMQTLMDLFNNTRLPIETLVAIEEVLGVVVRETDPSDELRRWCLIDEVLSQVSAQKRAADEAAGNLVQGFHYRGKERALMMAMEKIINAAIACDLSQANPATIGVYPEIFKVFEAAKRVFHASDETEFRLALADL